MTGGFIRRRNEDLRNIFEEIMIDVSSEVSIEEQVKTLEKTYQRVQRNPTRHDWTLQQESFDNPVKWHSFMSGYLITSSNHTKTNPSNHNFLYKKYYKRASTIIVLFNLNTDRLHPSY